MQAFKQHVIGMVLALEDSDEVKKNKISISGMMKKLPAHLFAMDFPAIGRYEMQVIGSLVGGCVKTSNLGFTVQVFDSGSGIGNYISNVDRPTMIKALEETLIRLKNSEDFETPKV